MASKSASVVRCNLSRAGGVSQESTAVHAEAVGHVSVLGVGGGGEVEHCKLGRFQVNCTFHEQLACFLKGRGQWQKLPDCAVRGGSACRHAVTRCGDGREVSATPRNRSHESGQVQQRGVLVLPHFLYV